MMFGNKKGQVVTVIFLFLMFIIFYILAFSSMISTFGANYVTINNATGLVALFYNNINVVIILVMTISVLALASRNQG